MNSESIETHKLGIKVNNKEMAEAVGHNNITKVFEPQTVQTQPHLQADLLAVVLF